MKTYLATIQQPVGPPPPPEVLEPVMAALGRLNQELQDTGALIFSGGLHQPETATVLRKEGDEVVLTDGPYAEGKEFIGGLYILRAADLDEALALGRRIAEAIGLPIEVKPFVS
jgi:hypothetical protein